MTRTSSHTDFLENLHMILPLLLPMCLTARCDNIKYHPLRRWQTPKECPLTSCTQLRPISLTAVIMRLLNDWSIGSNLPVFTTILKGLDGIANFVGIFSFDFSKAFDFISHNTFCSKLKEVNINPYIINWFISFLDQRKQRVVVVGYRTEYVSINRGVPQGTVLGPVSINQF